MATKQQQCTFIFLALAALAIPAAAYVLDNAVVEAQTLSKEDPSLIIDGPPLNISADDQDIDLAIDPNDNITDPSGQETISTTGATDIDINEIPYEGVTVVIQNKTVTVTTNPVTIGDASAAAAFLPPPETITEADD